MPEIKGFCVPPNSDALGFKKEIRKDVLLLPLQFSKSLNGFFWGFSFFFFYPAVTFPIGCYFNRDGIGCHIH